MRRSQTNRPPLAAVWLLGFLLLAGWGGAAFHHHAGEDPAHSCVACNAAHATAVPVEASIPSPPELAPTRGVVAAIADEPHDPRRGVHHTRAPPA